MFKLNAHFLFPRRIRESPGFRHTLLIEGWTGATKKKDRWAERIFYVLSLGAQRGKKTTRKSLLMSVSSTSLLFSQLKTFCFNVQQDSAKIAKSLEGKGNRGVGLGEEEQFIESLGSRVHLLRQSLAENETKVFGPVENRLSQITLEEVILYSNNSMIYL